MIKASSCRLVTSCLLAATSSALSPFVARFGGAARELASRADRAVAASASRDLAGVAAAVASARNVVVLLGAGASVSAGIPDFRTPGVGLYDNLEKYGKLPFPEAVFDLTFFAQNPAPFYALCKELWPGNYAPTPTHHFVALLAAKGKLRRCYTQNIDSLESAAGVPTELVVAAHGNMDSATCVATARRSRSPRSARRSAAPTRRAARDGRGRAARGVAGPCEASWWARQPRHRLFGEALPDRFFRALDADSRRATCCSSRARRSSSTRLRASRALRRRHAARAEPRAVREGPEVGFEFDSTSARTSTSGDRDAAVWSAAECLGWTTAARRVEPLTAIQTPGGVSQTGLPQLWPQRKACARTPCVRWAPPHAAAPAREPIKNLLPKSEFQAQL